MSTHTNPRISRPRPLAREKLVSPASSALPSLRHNVTKTKNRKKRRSLRTIKHMTIGGQDVAISNLRVFPISRFDLEQALPTIFKPTALARLLKESHTMEQVRAIAGVFVQYLDALMNSMERLPPDVRLDSAFQSALRGVLFAKDLFVSHTSQSHTNFSDVDVKERIRVAGELLERIIASLKDFLRIAEYAIICRKPLPGLPEEMTFEGSERADGGITVPLSDSPPPKSRATASPTMPKATNNGESPLSMDRKDGASAPAPSSTRRPSILARSLARMGKVRLPSLSLRGTLPWLNFLDTHSALPIPLDRCQSWSDLETLWATGTSQGSKGDTDLLSQTKTSPRHNVPDLLFIFPDPDAPERDVHMPRPAGDAFDIHVNSDDIVTKASLPALLTLLTSKECVTDSEFTDMFFVCFRFFSSPVEVFEGLLRRYDEEPPGPLSDAQLRVWTKEALFVKLRVAKILHTWLDLHWRRDMDQEIFEPLLAFTFQRLAKDLPFRLTSKLTEALAACAAYGEGYRGRRVQRRTKIAEMALKLKEASPTGFNHSLKGDMCQGDFVGVDILDFHTSSGREELARQLTLRVSHLYCLIDPEDAVTLWRGKEKKDDQVAQRVTAVISFEKALFFLCMHTILARPTPATRAVVMVFWLNLASICVRLRNFSIALSILSAIDNPCIFRLRHTRTEVFRTYKRSYEQLKNLFDSTKNYCNYRDAIQSSEMPAVPLLHVLVRDIYATKVVAPSVELCPEKKKLVINVSNYRVVAKTVRVMELCHIPYKLARVEYLQMWFDYAFRDFMNLERQDEETLMQELQAKSVLLEPRELSGSADI